MISIFQPHYIRKLLLDFLNQHRNLKLLKSSDFFDGDWYLANNTDVANSKMDPAIHYLNYGWKEGRNPSVLFDTNYYLRTYLDVKQAGMNPLIHFIYFGKNEGRNPISINCSNDLNNIYEVLPLRYLDTSKVKLGLVVMVRDEQDILKTFLNHIDVLFDYVLLIDHRSIDESPNILKQIVNSKKGWEYIFADINGKYQAEISDLSMSILFKQKSDFVFFLDCDEFIQVSDRETLLDKVSILYNPPRAGSLRWINCINQDIRKPNFTYDSSIWANVDESPYSKTVIPKSLYDRYEGDVFLTHGNHQVLDSRKTQIAPIEVGKILHIPIRSYRQLVKKSIISALSNISNAKKKPGDSYHIFKILEEIVNHEVSDDIIRGCNYLYQKESAILPLTMVDLSSDKFIKTSLRKQNIATSDRFSYGNDTNENVVLEKIVAKQILSFIMRILEICFMIKRIEKLL